jgi:transposase
MPQILLPVFPAQSTAINAELAFQSVDGQVFYFHSLMPIYQHPQADLASFRYITSMLIETGSTSQKQVAKAFGVPLITIRRYCKVWREQGPKGFFAPKPRIDGHKLTPELLAKVQELLSAGVNLGKIARDLNFPYSTLSKAVGDGRLKKK